MFIFQRKYPVLGSQNSKTNMFSFMAAISLSLYKPKAIQASSRKYYRTIFLNEL